MSPAPRPPFDQGLFLTHFNKGKDLYDQKRYDEAERELEEAYLLRPRDARVLNLLGLVYFKQDKYEKAEEIYRKLVADSPEAHTLFYNLGLIYFKLSRLEEAESAFNKALDLSGENPKISFYLGSIYERLQRFQDAIYQYRQAGANLMVRRVEDKIAAGAPPQPPGKAKHDTRPVKPVKKPEDTAEFKAKDVRERLHARPDAAFPPGKTIQPVSDVILSDNAPRRTSDTARIPAPETLPPVRPAQRFPEIITFPTRGALAGLQEPPVPAIRRSENVFRFLENSLLEINFSGKVFIKHGTIYSYGGNLTFWVKERRAGGVPALVIITGTGKVILTDKDREITLMHVEDEAVHVEPSHLLACEETLTPRYVPLATGRNREFLVLEGRGMVALSVASKPLSLTVTPDLPVSVPSASVITWSGNLTPHVLEDRQIYEIMLPAGREAGALLRLEGSGRLLVEQAL